MDDNTGTSSATSNASTIASSNSPSFSLTNNSLVILLSLLATLPLWLSPYPPMVDLPQHAAQIALMRNLHTGHFAFSNQFRIHWFTPYLFGYMLIYGLTYLVSIATACKIVIALFLAAIPLSTSLLLEQAGIETFWAILTIPGLYGSALQWGFLNFFVAVPIGLLFLWFVLRRAKGTRSGISISLAISAIALFFCHAMVCAFILLIAGCYLLADIRPLKNAAAIICSLSVVVPIAALWAHLTKGDIPTNGPFFKESVWMHARSILPRLLGVHLGFLMRLLGVHLGFLMWVLIGLALFIFPASANGVRKLSAPWIPFCICLGVLLFGPDRLFGTDFVSPRFTIFVLPLFLLVLKAGPLPHTRRLYSKAGVILLAIICIAVASRRALIFKTKISGFQQMLAQMQPGQRALSMVFDPNDGVSMAPTLMHFPSWYVSLKAGVVDPSMAMMFPELVQYSEGHVPKAVLWDFELNPGEFNWDKYDGAIYRYFIVRSPKPVDQYFSSSHCGVVLRYHSQEWWLYERTLNCAGSEQQRFTASSPQ